MLAHCGGYHLLTALQDLIALAVQGAGGGIASGADDTDPDRSQQQLGSNLMLAGIIFQLGKYWNIGLSFVFSWIPK